MKTNQGMLFPGPLPEPVTIEDLDVRLMLLCGYMLAALQNQKPRPPGARRQDELAGEALRWCVPYVRALTELALRHPEEFRALCPKPAAATTP